MLSSDSQHEEWTPPAKKPLPKKPRKRNEIGDDDIDDDEDEWRPPTKKQRKRIVDEDDEDFDEPDHCGVNFVQVGKVYQLVQN